MRTIAIETELSPSIWWWIRFSDEDVIYTTNQMSDLSNCDLRNLNLKRFNKVSQSLKKEELAEILSENNNIQIVNNSWIEIPWMIQDPGYHPILNKGVMIEYFKRFWLNSLIPYSQTIKSINSISDIEKFIEKNCKDYKKVVIKHPNIDWNGQWVFVITKDKPIREQIESALKKFNDYFVNISEPHDVINDEFIIQEFIEWDVEWSITFSLQNNRIENWWMVQNITRNWEYFLSTNHFWYLDKSKRIKIQNDLLFKLSELLTELQREGLRWNIWFDFLLDKNWNIRILECNWLHRTTGSTLPNSFWYNTKNNLFLWIPLNKDRINERYDLYNKKDMLTLAEDLQSFWTRAGEPQIMNIKTEWFEWNYPVSRISVAWNTLEELKDLLLKTGLLSQKWENYAKRLLDSIK